jgi:hypothetical protein
LFGTVGLNATRICADCGGVAEEGLTMADGLPAFTWTYAGLRKNIAQAAPTKMTIRLNSSQEFVFRVVVDDFFERDG